MRLTQLALRLVRSPLSDRCMALFCTLTAPIPAATNSLWWLTLSWYTFLFILPLPLQFRVALTRWNLIPTVRYISLVVPLPIKNALIFNRGTLTLPPSPIAGIPPTLRVPARTVTFYIKVTVRTAPNSPSTSPTAHYTVAHFLLTV